MIKSIFWSLLALACGYAVVTGGRDARWAVLLIVAATLLTIPALLLGPGWHRTDYGILAVDAGLLVGLYVLSLRSRRFFPLWMAGFQLVAVTSHLATLIAPHFTPPIYRALETIWSIPVIVSMVVGIAADRQAGMMDT